MFLTAAPCITALDSRDAIPNDLAPMVILDASGRVRTFYEQWEKATGMLVRLPTAPRNYSNLVVHLMDKGAGKTAWTDDRTCLSLSTEVARVIDSKPNEEWLVIYHKSVRRVAIPDQIMGLLSSDPDRVRFLNWGKHQGTNDYRHIKNVIIAGLNFYSEANYELMARCYGNTESDEPVPKSLVKEIEDGEHMHHLLQALCRASVRQGNGSDCGPCDAYIIAPKRSQMRRLLPKVFPNCIVRTWRPSGKKPKGKVQAALSYIEMHFDDYPDEVLTFKELQNELSITPSSNFRNSIRKHPCFRHGLEALGIAEVTIGNRRHRNAFARISMFGPVSACINAVEV